MYFHSHTIQHTDSASVRLSNRPSTGYCYNYTCFSTLLLICESVQTNRHTYIRWRQCRRRRRRRLFFIHKIFVVRRLVVWLVCGGGIDRWIIISSVVYIINTIFLFVHSSNQNVNYDFTSEICFTMKWVTNDKVAQRRRHSHTQSPPTNQRPSIHPSFFEIV